MQKWIKKGLIIKPWRQSASITHCQLPAPLHIKNGVYRIFYGSRNQQNCTQIFYCDYDIERFDIVEQTKEPVLISGREGCFDEHGIYPSYIVNNNGVIFMYTIGYAKGHDGMFYMRIGLGTSDDGKHFSRYSEAPILNPSRYDPWLVTAPCVLQDDGKFRMWYISGDKCNRNNGELDSYYHVKYAESFDGIDWNRDGHIAIGYKNSNETNIARPWILKEKGIYKAWYCYCNREVGYRIGYAESHDGGYTFERMDHLVGIEPSNETWENEAVAYPAVIVHKGRKYMFYNGNKFGKDGVALAVSK